MLTSIWCVIALFSVCNAMSQYNETVLASLNDEIDKIIVHNGEMKTVHGRVCLVCDKFVMRKEECLMSLKVFMKCAPYLTGKTDIARMVRDCYTCSFNLEDDPESMDILGRCLLSPRSQAVYRSDHAQSSSSEMGGRKKKNQGTNQAFMCWYASHVEGI